jgi:ATP-binding cassette, subfamily F, member 3
VSHDRYFVDRLATKVIEIGGGSAIVYPGTYEEFLWSRKNREVEATTAQRDAGSSKREPEAARRAPEVKPVGRAQASRQQQIEGRRAKKDADARKRRIEELEARIAAREEEIKALEARMSAAGFYENHETSKPLIDRHQALMWEIGDLMHQWESLAADTNL